MSSLDCVKHHLQILISKKHTIAALDRNGWYDYLHFELHFQIYNETCIWFPTNSSSLSVKNKNSSNVSKYATLVSYIIILSLLMKILLADNLTDGIT